MPKVSRNLPCVALLALALGGPLPAAPTPHTGLPGAISLTGPQRAALARLVRQDPEARALFAPVQRAAQAALADSPDPIARLQTEGKLPADPVKVQTLHSLQDMDKLAALGWAAAVTAGAAPVDPASPDAAKARQFILAWAAVNQPTGDPTDETNLEPLLVAYDLTRPGFAPDERARVDDWLRRVAAEEQRTGQRSSVSSRNNWNSHRLKIVGLIGYVLGDAALTGDALAGCRRQVAGDLEPDGSSYDFHERDALHYHCYTLEPLLALSIAARQNGVDLYDYRAPSGASVSQSVGFLAPYCDGGRAHPEFVNSHVAFDRKRAEAGDETYQAGRAFDTRQALKALSLAAAFDARYGALERKVAGAAAARFASWQDVLNAARQPLPAGH